MSSPLPKSLPIHIPARSVERFCREYGIREMALFGSVLREDFGLGSDVDVLVELPPDHDYSLFDLVRMADRLGRILHRKVDLVTKEGLSPHLAEEILTTRYVIYAAQE